ncbi:MAG: protein kinase [Gemmataceae bacterium]|nr:protein kinase [Gemmataceae bacterium]
MNDAVADDREQRLDEVVAGYLKAVKLGPAPTRQQLLDQHPDLAFELASFLDDHENVARLTTPLRNIFATAPAPTAGQSIGGYQLLEEIAHGGMGIVYRARQTALNRLVALKMMRSGPRATTSELLRFRAEAEAVANLDHPHIVPIYEVGDYEGQPFYSMKLIDGGSLSQRVQGFRDDPRAAARLLIAIAQAVHYAHQRGILHRDLKPANILLDAQGQPHVTDFGLAKRVEVDSSLTQSGAIIGTPSYMAPEQASGRKGAITTAADVYGLGAVLYEMLTGQPPFRGATMMDTLHMLLEQDPQKPRSINPRVPPDLETVCLKCLEKDPAARYPSAQVLADELQRFVNGEPIQARPVGSVERVWRLCRRKPLVAGLAALVVVLCAVGFPLVTVLMLRANRLADEANTNLILARDQTEKVVEQKQLVEKHLAEATASFRLAHDAVNTFCVQVERHLIHIPGLQGIRKELNNAALAYYREFLKQRGNDPELQAEVVRIHYRVAAITADTGSKAEALQRMQDVLAMYEKLAQGDQDPARYQKEIADVLRRIAIEQADLGQRREGLATLEKSRAIWEQLAARDPSSLALKVELARTYNNLGVGMGVAGKPDEALGWYQKAIDLQKELVAAKPSRAQYERDLANYYANLGGGYQNRGNKHDYLDAKVAYEKCHEIRQQTYKSNAGVPHVQFELALSYRDLANWHRRHGKPDDALPLLQEAIKLLQPVADASPTMTQFQMEFAILHRDMGFLLRRFGKRTEALGHFDKARIILERIAHLYAPGAPFQHDLAMIYFELGIGYGDHTKRDEPKEAYRKARAVLAKLIVAHPDNLDYHYKFGLASHNLATQLGPQGLLEDALPLLREAIEHQQVTVQRAPRSRAYRDLLTAHYAVFAAYLRKLGRWSESVAATQDRLKLWPDSGTELYQGARDLALAASGVGQDKPQLSIAEEKERTRYLDLAMTALKDAAAHGYNKVDQVQKDPALELLRPREDYKQLVAEMAKKAPKP